MTKDLPATPTKTQLKVREALAGMSNVHPCSKLTFTASKDREHAITYRTPSQEERGELNLSTELKMSKEQ